MSSLSQPSFCVPLTFTTPSSPLPPVDSNRPSPDPGSATFCLYERLIHLPKPQVLVCTTGLCQALVKVVGGNMWTGQHWASYAVNTLTTVCAGYALLVSLRCCKQVPLPGQLAIHDPSEAVNFFWSPWSFLWMHHVPVVSLCVLVSFYGDLSRIRANPNRLILT